MPLVCEVRALQVAEVLAFWLGSPNTPTQCCFVIIRRYFNLDSWDKFLCLIYVLQSLCSLNSLNFVKHKYLSYSNGFLSHIQLFIQQIFIKCLVWATSSVNSIKIEMLPVLFSTRSPLLRKCLAQNRNSINLCWMNKWKEAYPIPLVIICASSPALRVQRLWI